MMMLENPNNIYISMVLSKYIAPKVDVKLIFIL